MTNYNYKHTSQFRKIQDRDLGADALLMADFIEDMEALKPPYNKEDFGKSFVSNREDSATINNANEFHYYNNIAKKEYEKQNVGIGDISKSNDNTKTNTSFSSLFPSSTIHSSFFGEVTQQAEKPLIGKIIDWGKANPGKTMLLAGLAATGGYFLYYTLINKEKQQSRVSLQNKEKAWLKRKQHTKSGNYRNINSELGKTSKSETEGSNQSDSIKEAGLNLLAFFGGGIAGSSIGKQSLFVGIPLALYGLYSKNTYATCAGISMAISSYVINVYKKKENNTSNAQANKSLSISPANEIKLGIQPEELKTTSQVQISETSPTTFKTSSQPSTITGVMEESPEHQNQTSFMEGTESKEVMIEEDYFDREF